MALFIMIFFYLPILLFPIAYIFWGFWIAKKFSFLKLAIGGVLFGATYYWYIFAGSEIIDPYVRDLTSPKIVLEIESSKEGPPPVLALIVNHSDTVTELPKKIKVDAKGYSQMDFQWPKEFLDGKQFKGSGRSGGYSPQASNHNDPVSVYILRSDRLDINDPIFQKMIYLSTDPEKIRSHRDSGRSLNEIILELEDFE